MRGLILLIIIFPWVALAQDEGFNWADAFMPGGVIAAGVVMVIEFILGKTDWVKANSIVELVLNALLKLFKKDSEI